MRLVTALTWVTQKERNAFLCQSLKRDRPLAPGIRPMQSFRQGRELGDPQVPSARVRFSGTLERGASRVSLNTSTSPLIKGDFPKQMTRSMFLITLLSLGTTQESIKLSFGILSGRRFVRDLGDIRLALCHFRSSLTLNYRFTKKRQTWLHKTYGCVHLIPGRFRWNS